MCSSDLWPAAHAVDPDGQLSLTGLWQAMARPVTGEAERQRAAAAFHLSLADALVDWVAHQARRQACPAVALGGGCWINRPLRQRVVAGLQARGLVALEACEVPPGDGGLSLGQAAWALREALQAAPHSSDGGALRTASLSVPVE